MSDFEERLNEWFKPEHYELSKTSIFFEETTESGKCKVTFTLNKTGKLLKINWDGKNQLVFLKDDKNSDGVFLEFDEDNKAIALHVVELKKTVTLTKWGDIKSQYRSAIKHALGFIGVLNINLPSRLVSHSCYQNDNMSSQNESNIVQYKPVIGKKLNTDNQPNSLYDEWMGDKVTISSIFQPFEHNRHTLVQSEAELVPSKNIYL